MSAGCAIHGEAFTHGCPGCLDYADDLAIAAQVRERDAADTGERVALEDLIRASGFDPAELAREVYDPTPEGDSPEAADV